MEDQRGRGASARYPNSLFRLERLLDADRGHYFRRRSIAALARAPSLKPPIARPAAPPAHG